MLGWYSQEELKCLGSVGKNVLVDNTVQFTSPKNIHLADNVRIDAYCILSGTQGIEIGSQVHIASFCQLVASGGKITMQDFSGLSSRVSIFTASDDYVTGTLTNPTVPDQFKKLKIGPVVLEKHVIVGCGTIIMPNCNLGFGCSVGALTFVSKNIQSGDVVSGQPAKVLTTRNLEALRENEEKYHVFIKEQNRIPIFTYIDFSKSDKPQKWFEQQPPPFPSDPELYDMFMWKNYSSNEVEAWCAKYYRFDGTEWVEMGVRHG